MKKSYTSVVIVTAQDSARLRYVCDWVFGERLQVPYVIHSTRDTPVSEAALVLQYGVPGAFSIPASGILKMGEWNSLPAEWSVWRGLPICFAASGDYALPFDLLGAVFYLLSRMEEYAAFIPDRHGRYPAEASCLFQQGLLERPIVDEWIQAFGVWLSEVGLRVPQHRFQFTPTYDIDIAWSYRHKGLYRNVGGCVRDALSANFRAVWRRVQVLSGIRNDPFDSFDFLDEIHRHARLTPVYFILAALSPGPFDKNIAPGHPAMKRLIRHLADQYQIGIHPSYESLERPEIVHQELQVLMQTADKGVVRSRQHYIRFRLPDTFRYLADQGIQEEYSMGYATHLGFRAGTGSSFLWYDLSNEAVTFLRVHPFCFMDATAHYERSLTVKQAFTSLRSMRTLLEQSGSTMVTIFHNFSLGTDAEWLGWRDAYEQFIKESSR